MGGYPIFEGFGVPDDVEGIECSEVVYDPVTNELVCKDNGVVLSIGAPDITYSRNLTTTSEFTNDIVNDERKKKLMLALKLYREGLPIKEIVRRTGVRSMKELYRVLLFHGMRRRRRKGRHRKLTGKEIRQIIKEWLDGASIYSLSKKYGLSTSRIYYLINKEVPKAAVEERKKRVRRKKALIPNRK